MTMRRCLSRILLGLLLLCALCSPTLYAAETQQQPLLVFAAASLTDAMQELSADYQKTAHVRVRLSLDASSTLARQIESGARADVFFSADTAWMDYLEKRNLIQPATRRNLLSNTLVLIAPLQSDIKLTIAPHFALAAALGTGRLATGDPDSVPVGRYARSALTTLGVWDQIAPRLVRAANVRDALMYVARAEAPLGIVYGSDALIDKAAVRVVDTFPADTHEPIVYPIALTRTAQAHAAAFATYLASPQAEKIFLKYGFTVLAR
jgi:molybdate transport system substrate-binding protein